MNPESAQSNLNLQIKLRCLPSTYSFDKIKCYECPYSAICPGGS